MILVKNGGSHMKKITKTNREEDKYLVMHWMNDTPPFVLLNSTIKEAAKLLCENKMEFIPVVTPELKPIGVLSSKTIIENLLNGNADRMIYESKMDFTFQRINKEDSILDGIEHKDSPFYLVVDPDSRLIGVLSNTSILEAYRKYINDNYQSKITAEVLEVILDCAYEGVAVVDENAIVREFNDAYSRFTGIKKEDAIGKHVQQVIDNTNLHNTVKTGLPERGVIQYINGQPMVVNRIPIWREDKVVGAIGMLIFEGVGDLYRIYERFQEMAIKDQPLKMLHQAEPKNLRIEHIIGESESISRVKQLARKVAKTSATVLITGESGTGKEMLASSIHHLSSVSNGPFISVNCGAIPENLFESELFGYDEGAFTGAKKGGKPGKFELAQNGTIFLDEIAELSLVAQTKLLRVLQEREVEHVGGTKKYKINARIIAATNKDLKKMVALGEFREDLYYRINVIEIHIPPLRERVEDIPLLISYFLKSTCKKNNIEEKMITKETMSVFLQYPWFGNIRELANTIEKLVILSEGQIIDIYHLPRYMKEIGRMNPQETISNHNITSNIDSNFSSLEAKMYEGVHQNENQTILTQAKQLKDKTEKEMIITCLKKVGGNKSKAAKQLGIHRTTLYQKLKKYGIE